ncbi:MAG: iron ABC transporter permease [Alphaproteobacteria bacterium]|nr:iron ABC transporter permease [Alphaproteobacteria bacterium]
MTPSSQNRIKGVFGLALIGLMAVLTLYPTLRFLLLPFLSRSGHLGLAQVSAVSVRALVNSVRLSVLASTLAIACGVPAAWLMERRRWRGSGALMVSLWLLFVLPSYLMTAGWQIVFSRTALAHGALASAFYSQFGIIFLLALKGLPFATLAARTSWRAIGAELDDAARLLIRSPILRRAVLLQLLLPSVGAAFAVVFVESIQEFGIPATLGAQIHLPIVTYAIYERLATTPVNFAGAALLSWQLVGLALLAVTVQLYIAARFGGALIHGRRRAVLCPPPDSVEAFCAWSGLGLLVAVGLAIPLTALVSAAVARQPTAEHLPIAWDSILYSTLYAVLAASLAVAIATPILLRQRTAGTRYGQMIGALSLTNMALPGIVLGAAYLIAFNSGWLALYGTPLLLVFAYVAVQVPMLLRFLQAPIEHIHRNLSEAARLHAVPLSIRLLDVEAPLLAPALTWGWTMAFIQVFFELPISELLYPAGRAPVAVALLWLNQSLDYTSEARLALSAMLAALLVAGAASGLLKFLVRTPLVGEPA